MQEYMTSDSESDRSSISSINFTGRLDKLIGISDGAKNASRPRFKNQEERLAMMMQRKASDNSETDSATTGSESDATATNKRKRRVGINRRGAEARRKRRNQKKTRNSGPNPQAHLPTAQSNAAMTDPSEDHEETESENDGMNDRTTGNKNEERFARMQGDITRPKKPRP
jgi:hypothetical protein